MNKQKTIKVFMIHQWVMPDLQERIMKCLQSYPCYTFVDLSIPKSNPIPPDDEEFIQDIVCGRMMESDVVIVLPDTKEGVEDFDGGEDYLSDLSDTFRQNRGLRQDSVYTVEIRTLMFDACDTKPVLVLGWTQDSAEHLANKLRTPRVGGRRYNPDRFYAMGLSEAKGVHAIAKRIIAILGY
ncbi:MAG: hypothetical protein V5B40_11480 [Candidatus Accumulibacter meliphilus]|uniref:hypothetical protein n=1 Tax=Candidatus Accumulibacter meliphilus TaxID=2211374 RepID=UPI002FC3341E